MLNLMVNCMMKLDRPLILAWIAVHEHERTHRKVAVVTGAGRNTGRAIALTLPAAARRSWSTRAATAPRPRRWCA